MKHFALVFLLAILVPQECFHVSVEARDDFVRTRGIHFMQNGYPYYANGFNAYWLMYTASDPSQRFKVSNAFREAASHGLTVARTWAFSDGGYRPLQYFPGFYNEQMFTVRASLIFFFSFCLPFNMSFSCWMCYVCIFNFNVVCVLLEGRG